MPTLNDKEFGEIIIRKYSTASSIKARRSPSGKLSVSAPKNIPIFVIKNFIKQSRPQLRELIKVSTPKTIYSDGMSIGKSHSLIVKEAESLSVQTKNNKIVLGMPRGVNINDQEVVDELRPVIIRSLRKEAKAYLPRRLDFIAKDHDLSYSKVKFSHASSRWGSCSNNGTITLNIALMKLPFSLIDYVIAHELAHTIEMNHSSSFWRVVETIDPNYKSNRELLKEETPNI